MNDTTFNEETPRTQRNRRDSCFSSHFDGKTTCFRLWLLMIRSKFLGAPRWTLENPSVPHSLHYSSHATDRLGAGRRRMARSRAGLAPGFALRSARGGRATDGTDCDGSGPR